MADGGSYSGIVPILLREVAYVSMAIYFIVVFTTVVIGQRIYLGFGFTTLK